MHLIEAAEVATVAPSWLTPAVTILVALIGASSVWITIWFNRRTAERQKTQDLNRDLRSENADLRKENDGLRKRHFRLINYAQRLRDANYRGEPPPPEPWPEDLYDETES